MRPCNRHKSGDPDRAASSIYQEDIRQLLCSSSSMAAANSPTTKNTFLLTNVQALFTTSCAVLFLLAIFAFFISHMSATQSSFFSSSSSSPRPAVHDATIIGNGDLAAACDLFDGRWVVAAGNHHVYYKQGSCPFIDDSFNCFKNGRTDLNYTSFHWQPKACPLPRLDGRRMLQMLEGKRLAFVGDSLNRNMWESLICILRSSLQHKSRVYEVSGRQEFKTEGFYAFRFPDYNCTIEFFRSPFLVQDSEILDSNNSTKETLRLDLIDKSSDRYKDADVLIFNSGHWWTHPKTSEGKDYYQEGNHLHKQLSAKEAYHKALITWARWVDANLDPSRTRIFFRGYSSSHFKGGQWNSGGTCNGETLPITEDTQLAEYPQMMPILESVIREMKTPVLYLNITRMTGYRKDAHPSVFRQAAARSRPGLQIEDCSHWCLPGVPDTWNELLYAMLLRESIDELSSS